MKRLKLAKLLSAKIRLSWGTNLADDGSEDQGMKRSRD